MAPTTRSRRLASNEPSEGSSTSAPAPSRPATRAGERRSRRLASEEPEELGNYHSSPVAPALRRSRTRSASSPLYMYEQSLNSVYQGLPTIPRRRVAKPSKKAGAAVWDVAAAAMRCRRGELAFLRQLTKAQRLEVCAHLSAMNDATEARNDALQSSIDALAAENAQMRERLQAAEAALRRARTFRAPAINVTSPTSDTAPTYQTAVEQQSETTSPRRLPQPAETPSPRQPQPQQPSGTAQQTPSAFRRIFSYLSPFARRSATPSTSHTPSSFGDASGIITSTPKIQQQEQIAQRDEPQLQPTPVTARKTTVEIQNPDNTPLGDLSASRKRPASEEMENTEEQLQQKEEQEKTPRIKTPHRFLMPSTKNRQVPTSLSTVTEYTEQDTSYVPATTPSRPPPTRRTVTSVRQARLNAADTPTTGTPLSWNRRTTTPSRPRESNADARAEKMSHYLQLKHQLAKMNEDAEIKEMESHRRKRVKVDTLAYIPHNRPGESSGTFRVPDIDSDDEMEVDISVPERTNVFAEAAAMEKQQQQRETEISRQAAVTQVEEQRDLTISDASAIEEQHVQQVDVTMQSQQTAEEVDDFFNFEWPSVGPRQPEDDDWTAEQIEEARLEFERGWIQYAAEMGIPAELQ